MNEMRKQMCSFLLSDDQELEQLARELRVTRQDLKEHLDKDELAEAVRYLRDLREHLKEFRESKETRPMLLDQAVAEESVVKAICAPATMARRAIEARKQQAELLKKIRAEAEANIDSLRKTLWDIHRKLRKSRVKKLEEWYRRESSSGYPFLRASSLIYFCDKDTLSEIFENVIRDELNHRIQAFRDLAELGFEYSWDCDVFLLLTGVDYLTRGKGVPCADFNFIVEAVFETEVILKEQTLVRDLYTIDVGPDSLGYFCFSTAIDQIQKAVPLPLIRGILANEIEPQGTKVLYRTANEIRYRVENMENETTDISDSLASLIKSLPGEGSFAQGLLDHKFSDQKTTALIEAKLKFIPGAFEISGQPESGGDEVGEQAIVGALQSLGYPKNTSHDLYKKAKSNFPVGASLEDKIQNCLKVID